MSYTHRVTRFTVQERLGAGIKSIKESDSALYIDTVMAFDDLCGNIALFCDGIANMHHMDIAHGDLHFYNITISQSDDKKRVTFK